MDGIGSVNASGTQAAGAVQAAQANTAAGTPGTQQAVSGLPPTSLAQAASANTIMAELVSSQWGIDPASVGGVYGGAGESGGLFSGDTLLPLLTNLTHANAEQALALIGVKTPTPGSGTPASSTAAATGSTAAQSQAAAQAAASPSGPMVVDPLWGRSA
jgi:hypothetical protein